MNLVLLLRAWWNRKGCDKRWKSVVKAKKDAIRKGIAICSLRECWIPSQLNVFSSTIFVQSSRRGAGVRPWVASLGCGCSAGRYFWTKKTHLNGWNSKNCCPLVQVSRIFLIAALAFQHKAFIRVSYRMTVFPGTHLYEPVKTKKVQA